MNKRILIKAVFDGLIQSLILAGLGTFSISVYSANLALEQYLLIGVICAIFSAVVYAVFTVKEFSNKKIIYFSLVGILCFVLSIVSILALYLTFSFNFVPLREINNADGILILFSIVCYILASIIFRICIFVLSIIKNTHQT